MKFPGWWALIPTWGTAALILVGPLAWINKNILSKKPLVFIGLISYPLYLWHWPLLSFATIVEGGEPPAWIRIIAISLSFVLAILTYKFVEKPLRKKRGWTTAFLIITMVLIGGAGKLIAKKIIPPSIKNKEILPIVSAINDWQYPPPGFKNLDEKGLIFSKFGKSKDTVLFVGDSNMQQYASRIAHLMEKDKTSKSVVFAAAGGWLPIPNTYEDSHLIYRGLMNEVMRLAKDKNVKRIVIGAIWNNYGSPYYYEKNGKKLLLGKGNSGQEAAYLELKRLVQTLIRNHKKVYLILSMPSGGEFDPRAMFKRNYFGKFEKKILEVKKDTVSQRVEETHSRLKRIGAETGATIIDPVEFLCSSGICKNTSKEGNPLYKDGGHLRPSYVEKHATFLDQIMD